MPHTNLQNAWNGFLREMKKVSPTSVTVGIILLVLLGLLLLAVFMPKTYRRGRRAITGGGVM